MNTEETVLPGLCIGALAMASGTDFVDAALGVATVLGGIAGPMAAIDGPSQSRVAEGIGTVDNTPAPRANEV